MGRTVVAVPYDVRSPVTKRELASLDDRPEIIQFASALTTRDYALLGEWFAEHPRKTLRAYASYDGTITDLEFLRHFPTLRSFQADALHHSLTDIAGLRHLPDDVRFLALGKTRKSLSLLPLARFAQLESLYIEGQTRDLAVISELAELRSLRLRSITLPDLSLLVPLRKLRALELKLGGTKNLAMLPDLAPLEYLELWMVKGLADLSPVAELHELEYLFLQSLRQVAELPDMSHLTRLERLWIETMRGLADLSPVVDAPRLRQLAVIDMGHLEPEAFRPIAGHPTLESLRYGLGSTRKNDAVQQIIDLPGEGDWGKPVG